LTDRSERKNLRLDFGLEVEHDSNHAGFEAPDAQIADIGVAERDFSGESFLDALKIDVFEVEHEPLWVSQEDQAVPQGLSRFHGYARIVRRRPDADRPYRFRGRFGGRNRARENQNGAERRTPQRP